MKILGNKKEVNNIVFACNDGYTSHLLVAIYSLFKFYNGKVKVTVLNSDICEKTVKFANKMASDFKQPSIDFSQVKRSEMNSLPINSDYISIETYYRYLIPTKLKGVSKAVYLDADIVILRDLSRLFQINLEGKCIAGVKDPHVIKQGYLEEIGRESLLNRYINAGVLIMDLKKMRENDIEGKLFSMTLSLGKNARYQDQDAINFVLEEDIKHIDKKYNFMSDHRHGIGQFFISPFIVHYNGAGKPWDSDAKAKYWNKVYRKIEEEFYLYKRQLNIVDLK